MLLRLLPLEIAWLHGFSRYSDSLFILGINFPTSKPVAQAHFVEIFYNEML